MNHPNCFRTAGSWLMFAAVAAAAPATVRSPDGRLLLRLDDSAGRLRYSLVLDGREVLAPSDIGIRSNGLEYGRDAVLGKPVTRKVEEVYPLPGVKARAVNRAVEAVLSVGGPAGCQLDVHVADDGAAVRLRLPAQAGRRIEADRSTWVLPGDPDVWSMPSDAPYEGTYHGGRLSALEPKPLGMPLTARVGSTYLTLNEAVLRDYGDLELRPAAGGVLEGFLAHDPKGWTSGAEVVQPWRVTVVARDLTALVNTTLVQNLNPPADPALAKASWIRPGRSAWQWMAVGDPKFADQHQWVDWTKDLGYEYYLVDEGLERWSDPWGSLKSVCDYAKTRGVGIWLWVHSKEVKDDAARTAYFRKAVEAGAVGVKIDFPRPADHEWTSWYPAAARDAAALHLMVDFHGAVKPTGMERTWPNELTREGIRGHEWHITRYHRVLEPQHDEILPFTRYVVGHGDYTPVVFAPKELQGNTWAHELAQAVVFTSPFLCTGGHPKDYLANPARDVMSALPACWDETRVLPGSEPGKIAAFARRKGNQWFIGVLNGAEAANLDIRLDFLGGARLRGVLLGDAAGRADAWDRSERTTGAADVLHVKLAARGGYVAWFRP